MRQRVVASIVGLTLLAACGRSEPEPAPAPPAAPVATPHVRSFDGVPIAYEVAGEGPGAVVLIHGWSLDRSLWSAQVADLSRDYRVVALDLAGHGESGSQRERWTLASLARDVEAVVRELDLGPVVLVGHSMGGPVALEAAGRLPERVVGIVGVDTLHDLEWDFPEEQWRSLLDSYERDFQGTCGRMVRSMFPRSADPALVSRTETGMCAAPPEVAVALMHDFATFDPVAAARGCRVPVRAINATTMPTNVEANRRHLDFDVVLMEGVGHFPMLERPDELNVHLRRAIEELTGTIR